MLNHSDTFDQTVVKEIQRPPLMVEMQYKSFSKAEGRRVSNPPLNQRPEQSARWRLN